MTDREQKLAYAEETKPNGPAPTGITGGGEIYPLTDTEADTLSGCVEHLEKAWEYACELLQSELHTTQKNGQPARVEDTAAAEILPPIAAAYWAVMGWIR